MKELLSKYKLIYISWYDAALHGNEQVSIEDIKDYGIMYGHIAGWLVNETDKFVTIAMDFFPRQNDNDKDTFRTFQSYPKSGIEKMEVIKELEIYNVRHRTTSNN